MTMPPSLLSVPAQGYALSVSSASCGSHSPSNSVLTGTPRAVAIRPSVDRRHSVMPSFSRSLWIVALESPEASTASLMVTFLSFIIFFTLLLNAILFFLNFLLSIVSFLLTYLTHDAKTNTTKGQQEDSPPRCYQHQDGPNPEPHERGVNHGYRQHSRNSLPRQPSVASMPFLPTMRKPPARARKRPLQPASAS